jgi:hypothetical protein
MLLVALTAFVTRHKAHGQLTADAAEPVGDGYLLTGSCTRRRVHPLGHAQAA